MYYIINKVHSINNELAYTPIGYVLTESDMEYVIEQDKIDFATQWVIDNYTALTDGTIGSDDFVAQSEFDSFYASGHTTTSVVEMGIELITDLDNPEGV
jgi:hypothetical protein